jgi:Protein of unknown function (DUF3126)
MTPTEVSKLTAYLRKVYGSRTLAVRPRPKSAMVADLCQGDQVIGTVTVDDEDGDRSYQLAYEIKEKPQPLSVTELLRLQAVLRETLGAKTLVVRARAKVFVGDESYAILSADKASYQFQMAILDIDLEDEAE